LRLGERAVSAHVLIRRGEEKEKKPALRMPEKKRPRGRKAGEEPNSRVLI